MHLITMAHLGEAQGVIEKFSLKRSSPSFYEGENLCLLLTGEGPFEAATQTALALGKKDYSKVINIGIAGSLKENLQIGDIFEVRSLYLYLENKPAFKSFQASQQGIDCLTSFERILNPEKLIPLKGIASLVDRESWGVAFASKTAGVSFECYKLISDQAGTLGACELVRENAEIWSQKLANYLEQKLEHKIGNKASLELKGFHFTFTMKHKFEDLLSKLSIKEGLSREDILNSLPLKNPSEEKILPKERAIRLLENMEERLNPISKVINQRIESWQNDFEKLGIRVQVDPLLENENVRVSFEAKNDQEIKSKIQALSSMTLTPYQDLLKGILDVE